MNNLNATQIAELTIDALERTAFVLAELAEEGAEPDLAPAERFARIGYSGPSNGHLYLAASDGFVRELASSMLGVETEDIAETQCTDALRELTNIVGGLVVLELGGTDRLLSLGLPELVTKESVPKSGDNVQNCCLDSECERLEVIWESADNHAA